jgi:nitric oxide reductase subunit B
MWIFLHFFPIGWSQLNAVYEHGYAWARSRAFYDQTRFWQWMRLPGDVVFSIGGLLMSWDFVMKLRRPGGQGLQRDPGDTDPALVS